MARSSMLRAGRSGKPTSNAIRLVFDKAKTDAASHQRSRATRGVVAIHRVETRPRTHENHRLPPIERHLAAMARALWPQKPR